MSMRLDHMAELMDNDSAPKVPINYKNAISNFLPAEGAEPSPAQEERRPTPFDGITADYKTSSVSRVKPKILSESFNLERGSVGDEITQLFRDRQDAFSGEYPNTISIKASEIPSDATKYIEDLFDTYLKDDEVVKINWRDANSQEITDATQITIEIEDIQSPETLQVPQEILDRSIAFMPKSEAREEKRTERLPASGAELTASLVASGTSLESFGKGTLIQLAESYGIELPKGAKRGEIIDAINERPIQAPVAAQPQETDTRFMPSSKVDEAVADLEKRYKAGDKAAIEEAKRLVDERATEAGVDSSRYWYHGTAGDEFFVPKGRRGVAAHVSLNKGEAENFAWQAENELEDGGELNVLEWYLKKGDLFDPTDESHVERVQKVLDDAGISGSGAQYNPETWKNKIWSTFENPVAQKAIKDAGFIGYKDRESAYTAWEDTENAAIFDANNIKSADPFTYDDEGKLIPPSQRFDTSKPDIRFMPYSPELPKTEDGKIDWEGFKTKTLEIAKPLAGLTPIGGVSFMPAKKPVVAQAGYDDAYLKKALKNGKDGKVKLTRPFRADEALPTMEQLPIIGNQVDRNIFKYNQPAEVIFYENDGTPVSFKWDGQMLVQPEFKDIAEEHAGKAVQLAMADRQTATGGDMGGVMHTFLKSLRTITIKDPLTGNDLIVVWANNEWKPAKNMKDKVRMFGAKDLLTYLMGEEAHASNARSVRRISNEIDNSGLNDKEIDTFLILANKGVKTARTAEQNKTITDSLAAIEKATKALKKEKSPEKINKLKKDIKVSQRSISDAEAKLPQYEITPEETEFSQIIKNFKSSFTGFSRGTRSEANFKAKEKEFYDFLKTATFTKLRKAIRGKRMIKLDDTFKGRKAAVQNLLGLTINGFNIDHILPMTADFKGGRIHHIVSSVELSTNPELGAVYLGEDPEQAKFMTPLEAAAAAKIKADPNFVVHEAYAWGMLGPVEGNHFLNTNPRTPEEYFPAFRKRYAATKETAEKADKITNASESNLVNTMRDQKSFALTLSNKSKKSKK
jgi:hypothetical protein